MSLEITFEERLEKVKKRVNNLLNLCSLRQKKLAEYYNAEGERIYGVNPEDQKKRDEIWSGVEAFNYTFEKIAKLNDENGITKPWVLLN